MPLYEYQCRGMHKFELVQDVDKRFDAHCPICGRQAGLLMSVFSWRLFNPFSKDGEGFTSVSMSKQESNERAKANAGKYD